MVHPNQSRLTIHRMDDDVHFSKLTRADNAAFNSYDSQHAPLCLPNTRTELLDDIKAWARKPSEKTIFWLSGMAGTGKSTIARSIATFFSDNQTLAGSFFFKRGGGEASRAAQFCTTLALQFAEFSPALARTISKVISSRPSIATQTMRDQWRYLIFEPLSSIKAGALPAKVVIVIDALDECEGDDDVRLVLRLLTQLKDCRNVKVQVLLTSRPETSIRFGFREMPEIMHRDLALHTISRSIVEKDIELFYRHELEKIGRERKVTKPWPSDANIITLVTYAEGLFQYAATVCAFVGGDRRISPSKRLEGLLQGSSSAPISKLDAMYLQVLQNYVTVEYSGDEAEKQELAMSFKTFVGAIVVLTDSLSASSLCNLLSGPASGADPEELLESTLLPLASLLDVVESDPDWPIRPLHDSFRGFLLHPDRCIENQFQINAAATHRLIFDGAIDLMSRALKNDICGLKHPGTLAKDIEKTNIEYRISKELQYACRNWALHLRNCATAERRGVQLYQFLTTNFLQWLEVLSIIGYLYDAIGMIVSVQELFKVKFIQKIRCSYTCTNLEMLSPAATPTSKTFWKTPGGSS